MLLHFFGIEIGKNSTQTAYAFTISADEKTCLELSVFFM